MFVYIVFFSVFTAIVLIGQLKLKNTLRKEPTDLLNQLTVIIPFRNEANNLPSLLQSIQNQEVLPKRILLINDHSEDDFEEIIHSFERLPIEVLHLDSQKGKKAAIQLGIENTLTTYTLTLDADIELPSSYFSTLQYISLQDAHILPVRIQGQDFFSFFNFDYYYLFLLNSGLHFFLKPFTASGANFLFKTEIYKNFLSTDTHQNTSSGDDIYFLQYLNQKGYKTQISIDSNLTVSTSFPSDFSSILHQRVRWLKKSSSTTTTSIILSLIGLVYHFGFITLLFIHSDKWIELTLLKISWDWVIFLPYLNRINTSFHPLRLSIFSLLFPFWIVFILISSIFIRPIWKKRAILS